jgi:tyrosyl-tRNA synthetase
VIRFLKLFTEVPIEQIHDYSKLSGSNLNAVKRVLADEATSLLHGKECLSKIHQTVDNLFQVSSSSSSLGDLSSVPHIQLTESQLFLDDQQQQTIGLAEILVLTSIVKTKSEGRRLIKSGGVKINEEKREDEFLKLSQKDFESFEGKIKVSAGKKKHYIILWPTELK